MIPPAPAPAPHRSPPSRAASADPAIETTLVTEDGTRLSALRYVPAGPARGRLVVAGATGVPQGFYRSFAEFARARGYDVLTLDYRGIGRSRLAPLRGYRMNYLDWATQDIAAAVQHMAGDDLPLFMIGHSFGGHAFGLLPNHDRVARFYTFATGAGWHGWMPPVERVRVWLMWNVLGPLIVRWKGYLAWSLLGMGEDLPHGVYRDWRRWCSHPHYFFDDPAVSAVVRASFDRVRTPIVAVNALDDLWAPPASRDAFMAGYRAVSVQAVDLDPHTAGIGPIGHMGYFRRKAEPLWHNALAWFDEHPAVQPTR